MKSTVDFSYQIVRSNRKTIGISVDRDGAVTVRAPRYTTDAKIRELLMEKADWIRAALARRAEAKQEAQQEGHLTMDEIRALADKAIEVIPERVRHYAPLVGVTYGRITIRNQKTRWGSCTREGNLNFNCLLMLAPPDVLDSVVVHELCHRLEMNHSNRFYQEVYRVFPDYDRCAGWLKEHGTALMNRML